MNPLTFYLILFSIYNSVLSHLYIQLLLKESYYYATSTSNLYNQIQTSNGSTVGKWKNRADTVHEYGLSSSTNEFQQYVILSLEVGDFVHTLGDAHLYSNHFDQVDEQLSRTPRALPQLVIKTEKESIFDYEIEDLVMDGYDPYPRIKAPIAV
ncbi:hypothetical protein JFL43_09650 [Viridibacillus sp. YIM B01967]|uniref:Thymidylate synthase/dCMP hydroxymethylase domain-containing protein n=1 Tax=Viridibacillus soli TaxID=2798301 RepID=A0ABS1H6S1_9BACL|nr:hypothetical protein [Viridibacillus soli]